MLGFVTRMRADVSLSGPLGPGGLRRNSPFGTLAVIPHFMREAK